MSVFSLYWGATYQRSKHMHKVKILAVVQDEPGTGTGIASSIPTLAEQAPGTWHVYNTSSFQQKYGVAQDEVDAKIQQLVHDQKYWVSLNVKPNATSTLIESLQNSRASPFNSSAFFELFYESGRDPTNLKSSILPIALSLESRYQNIYASTILPGILSNITQRVGDVSRNVAMAGNMVFAQVDNRPFNDYVLLGPLQVGLIYCILLTFFQLALFGPIHALLGQKLKPVHMLLYRYVIAFVNYFFLSLFFCLVSLAFQVDFTKASFW